MHSIVRLFLLLGIVPFCQATEYYVATNGSNTAVGTLAAPWATIQYAIDQAAAGDTVLVHGGVYSERIVFHHSGSEGAPITLKNVSDEVVAMDGSGFTVACGWDALLTVASHNYITIDGLEIRHMITALKNRIPIGLLLHGTSKGGRRWHARFRQRIPPPERNH